MKILNNIAVCNNTNVSFTKKQDEKPKVIGKSFFSPVERLPYSDSYGKAMVESQNRFRNIRKVVVFNQMPVFDGNRAFIDKVTTYTPMVGKKIAQKSEGKNYLKEPVSYIEFFKPDGKTVDFVYDEVEESFATEGKPSVGKTTINDKPAYDLDFTDIVGTSNIYGKFEAPANCEKYEDAEISGMYLQRYSDKIDDYVKYHYGREFLENWEKPEDVMYIEMPNREFYAVYGIASDDKIVLSKGNNFKEKNGLNPSEYEILGVFDREKMDYELMSGTISEDGFAKLFTHAVDVCQDMLYMRDYAVATYQKCEKSLNLLKENS